MVLCTSPGASACAAGASEVPWAESEGSDLPPDLAAQVPHLTSKREDVARDNAALVDHNVSPHSYQIATDAPVHISVPVYYEQVPAEIFR